MQFPRQKIISEPADEAHTIESCTYCHLPLPQGLRPSKEHGIQNEFCCYGCRFAFEVSGAGGIAGQSNATLVKLGTAVVLTMAVMVFTLPLYTLNHSPWNPNESPGLEDQWTAMLKYAALVLSLPVFGLLGIPLFSNAIEQYRRGSVSTDGLIVIGVAAALATSVYATVAERGHTYFETVCMLLVLVTLGRYLETRGKVRASEALLSLESLLPEEVDVTRSSRRLRISIDGLMVADEVHIAAGQTIPVDGIVESGEGFVNEQIITGESAPIQKTVGDTVSAGSTSLDAAMTIRVSAVGSNSTIGRLASLLESARQSKGRLARLADKLARFFLPVVILLAILGAWFGWQAGGLGSATNRALAVLLISCPCALGIAIPLAGWISMDRAARRGLLFRSGDALEALATVRALAFDKTGTLTTGTPRVHAFVVDNSDQRDHMLSLAAGLSRTSNHVLATAVVNHAQDESVEPAKINSSKTIPGFGIKGRVDESTLRWGSVAMMNRDRCKFKNGLHEFTTQSMESGRSISCLAVDDCVEAAASFSELLRESTAQTISESQELGLQLEVWTGDHKVRAAAIESKLGIPVHGELHPADKLERLSQLRRETGSVAMVGDGLNDAPVLAAADVGLAMGCGADISRDSADVCLMGNDLATIPWAIRLARMTRRIMRGNLTWAFLYNGCCLPLALAGKLTPVLAAIAMVLSSLFVVMNSSRLSTVDLND